MSIPSNVLPLKTPLNITGVSNATVTSGANAVAVNNVEININPLQPGSIIVTLRYGSIVNGSFVEAPISSADAIRSVVIDNNDLLLLGDTPLSPKEREMTPFSIIQYRIFSILSTKGIVKLG